MTKNYPQPLFNYGANKKLTDDNLIILSHVTSLLDIMLFINE